MIEYVHKVYGTAWARVMDLDGTIRDATPEELKELGAIYEPALERSFRIPAPTELPKSEAPLDSRPYYRRFERRRYR